MPRFRKKPVVIEAEQWFPGAEVAGVYLERVSATSEAHVRFGLAVGTELAWIDTLEGRHRVQPGDWIITGVKGEKYPIKDEIFAATYEPAEAA